MTKPKHIWITNKVSESKAEVLLYGYIDPYDVSASEFVKELRALEKEYTHIDVRINSGGGSVFEGFAIYNALKNSSANIETYIDGLAASMASVIALGGKKVHMSKVARYMTHQPSTGGYGTSDELRKNADLLDGLEKSVCAVYSEKTGKTAEECKTLFLNGKDNWFTATQAKEYGLIDSIYDAEEVDEPKSNADEKVVYDHYANLFAARFDKPQNLDMKQFNASQALLVAMSLPTDASQEAFEVAVNALVEKAKKVDNIQARLDQATTKIATLEKKEKTDKVASLLAKAEADKKVNAQMKATLGKQYAENPEWLEELLNSMQAYTPIVPTLQSDDEGQPTAKELATEYTKLDQAGGLPELKANNPERYKTLFKAKFGVEPNM